MCTLPPTHSALYNNLLHYLQCLFPCGQHRPNERMQRHLTLRIKAEELTVGRMVCLVRHVGVTQYLPVTDFICRKKLSQGENFRLMLRSRAGRYVAQIHRKYPQLPQEALANVGCVFIPVKGCKWPHHILLPGMMSSSSKVKSLEGGEWSMCFKMRGTRFSPIAAVHARCSNGAQSSAPYLCAAAWSVFIFTVASCSPER